MTGLRHSSTTESSPLVEERASACHEASPRRPYSTGRSLGRAVAHPGRCARPCRDGRRSTSSSCRDGSFYVGSTTRPRAFRHECSTTRALRCGVHAADRLPGRAVWCMPSSTASDDGVRRREAAPGVEQIASAEALIDGETSMLLAGLASRRAGKAPAWREVSFEARGLVTALRPTSTTEWSKPPAVRGARGRRGRPGACTASGRRSGRSTPSPGARTGATCRGRRRRRRGRGSGRRSRTGSCSVLHVLHLARADVRALRDVRLRVGHVAVRALPDLSRCRTQSRRVRTSSP